MLIVLQDFFGSLISYNIPISIIIIVYLLLILSKVHCILQSFIIYMDKRILWVYTIILFTKNIVFTKKQKKEEIILCVMFCGKKKISAESGRSIKTSELFVKCGSY